MSTEVRNSLLDFLNEAEEKAENQLHTESSWLLTKIQSATAARRGLTSPGASPAREATRGIPSLASSTRPDSGSASTSDGSDVQKTPSTGDEGQTAGTGNSSSGMTSTPAAVAATSVLEGVKAKMASLRQEIETKDKQIAELREEISRRQAERKELEESHKRSLKEQLSAQKGEFEEVIQRHLAFISKVVSDKEALTKRVAELTEQLELVQKTAAKQLEEQASALTANFKKQRDTWVAAEKLRREAWIQERTQAIKEMTIRGLEPELQKLMETSKSELQRAQEQHTEALRLQREELLADFAREKELLKRQLVLEKEQALDQERQRSAERLQEAVARGDDLLRESRARLLQECAQEKQMALASKDAEIESLREELKAQHLRETQKVAAALEEQRRKHEAFIAQLRDQEKLERELWYSNMIKKLQREAVEKIEKIRAKLTEERDEELNLVIARLTRESAQAQQQAVEEYEGKLQELTRLRRLDNEANAAKEQRLESQIAEWQQKCTNLQNRWEQLQTRLNTSQLSLTEKDRELRQLVMQLQQAEDKLAHERQMHATAIEQARLESSRQREKELRAQFDEEMKALRASAEAARKELEAQLEQSKNREMEELHARVKAMLEKKDKVISDLRAAILRQERQIIELQSFIEPRQDGSV